MSLTGRQFIFKDTIYFANMEISRIIDSEAYPLFISGGEEQKRIYAYSGNFYYGNGSTLVYAGSVGTKWIGREQYKKIKFIAEPTRYIYDGSNITEEAFLTWLLGQAEEVFDLNYIVLPNGSTCNLVPEMNGATSQSSGSSGRVPAPSAGDQNKVLKGNGTWENITELPSVSSSDEGKIPIVNNNGEWETEPLDTFYRQYWDSTNTISVSLASGKNYMAWTAASSSGTTGAIMDATSGSLVFISNGKYAVIHKGSDITISVSNNNLVFTSSSNIAMGIVEL